MSDIRRRIIRASALPLAVVVVGCADDHCDFTNVHDYPSPDDRMRLTVFEYCCYNTTGYDKQLHLRRRGEELPTQGNVYTLSPWTEVTVSWRDSTNVVVGLKQPPTDATNVEGITVTFTGMRPTN